MEWAENNVSMPDGSWVNDVNVNLWNGITVFASIALGEALKFHGHLLDNHTRLTWTERLRKACNFLMDFMTIETSNINYPLSCSYALALCGKLLNEDRFVTRAKELVSQGMDYFSEENSFIFGEGKLRTASPKGCFPVDLGYNVEETLPCLTHYAILMEDNSLREKLITSWNTHLEFMLSDGAWDNSWGTRNHKWTYWGSRTSDGCQAGLVLLSDYSSRFPEAAYRNALLLDKCTVNGILYGGPHYVSHEVQPCIHHSFTHAKSLASALNHLPSLKNKFERCPLPCDRMPRLKRYREIDTWLISEGNWRATVTGYDCEYPESPHATGGAISLLHHRKLGLILSDSLPEAKMREAANMQMNTDAVQMTLIPRVELVSGGIAYRTSRYRDALLTGEENSNEIILRVKTRLVDFDHHDPETGTVNCNLSYFFSQNEVRIEAGMVEFTDPGTLQFILPVVSPVTEKVIRTSSRQIEIEKENGNLLVSSNAPLSIREMNQKRIFSHSPGIEAVPIVINWSTVNYPTIQISLTTRLA